MAADQREREDDAEREEEFGLDDDLAWNVSAALDAEAAERIAQLIDPLHPADVADLIEQLSASRRPQLIAALTDERLPEVLSELEEGARDTVLEYLAPERLSAALKELDSDDIVYLVEDLDEREQKRALAGLEEHERAVVEQSLAYPEYSAGRLMQREVVTAPPFWTVGQMIDFMRAADDLPDPFYDVLIVDPARRPIGKAPLSRILGARRPMTLEGLMETDFRTIRVDEPQEDVAYAFNQYHLVSTPVTDASGRLVGVITIDDAMEVLEDEAEEDIRRLGGVGDEELSDKVFDIVKQRAPWLAVNLVTAIIASLVIAMFDEVIGAVVALAVLMPIVASMGGNAATQTLTVTVRALATRDLTMTNALRVIGREAAVGAVNGAAFAIIVSLVGIVWYGDATLGLVLALAMVTNMIAAGLAGILIPMGLDRLGVDPALASGTFVTTVTDVVGFFAFLGIGAALLL